MIKELKVLGSTIDNMFKISSTCIGLFEKVRFSEFINQNTLITITNKKIIQVISNNDRDFNILYINFKDITDIKIYNSLYIVDTENVIVIEADNSTLNEMLSYIKQNKGVEINDKH